MKKIIRVLLAAVFTATGLTGFATESADAQVIRSWTRPQCEETGNIFSRHISICVTARFVDRPGECPHWRKVRVYIGTGGGALEEGNGGVVRGFTVFRPNGTKVRHINAFNLVETDREDHYRHTVRLRHVRARFITVAAGYELFVDNGFNRNGTFVFEIKPRAFCG